jgi:hypothetical protein
MSATDAFETLVLQHYFTNIATTNVGDATGMPAGVEGFCQISLATVAYVDSDTVMTADECDYTGYTRIADVARSATGWTVSGASCTNAALEQFGEMSGGASDTAVHCGIGFIATGDVLRIHADLDADLIVNVGVNPQFAIGALDITLD